MNECTQRFEAGSDPPPTYIIASPIYYQLHVLSSLDNDFQATGTSDRFTAPFDSNDLQQIDSNSHFRKVILTAV